MDLRLPLLAAAVLSRPRRAAGDVTERLLTTREVAAFLRLSSETVLRRYRAGELPGIRLGSNVLRFRESALEEFLQDGATSPAPEPSNRPAGVA